MHPRCKRTRQREQALSGNHFLFNTVPRFPPNGPEQNKALALGRVRLPLFGHLLFLRNLF